MKELDRHLFGEGRHEKLWTVLGAHPSANGTSFAVWAPNAQEVQLVGDFNGWDGSQHPMARDAHGVWNLEAEVGSGALYKFKVRGADGRWIDKADPFAFRAQHPPETASVVYDSSYVWSDASWLEQRVHRQPHAEPMSIYEVHLGSWKHGRSYRDLADELVAYVRELGFTHVELMPVMEHPFGGSWGYQVTGYFAPTARFGEPDDLRALIDALHQAGIGVIVDWVPAHFPRDEWALARFDGTPLYEHPDPRRGEHPDWGTLIFDYGRPEVRNFLVANALFWIEEFHVDGLRVDAVASMLYLDYSRGDDWEPNVNGGRENLEALAFLQELNGTCYRDHPGVSIIAEESTAWPGVTRATDQDGLGFGFKWNLGWMHDTLGYFSEDPVNRSHHHNQATFAMMYAYADNFMLPLSHDEVVHGKGSLVGKMPGSPEQQRANLRALLAFQWAHPGKQLMFMGAELAQTREWAADGELDWGLLEDPQHAGVHRLVGDLNRVYTREAALWGGDHDPSGFSWIDANDAASNVLSFERVWGDSRLVCIYNFSGATHEGFRVGMPAAGSWRQVLNTDAPQYGGWGVDNAGTIVTEDIPWQSRGVSAVVRLPALSAVWLKADG